MSLQKPVVHLLHMQTGDWVTVARSLHRHLGTFSYRSFNCFTSCTGASLSVSTEETMLTVLQLDDRSDLLFVAALRASVVEQPGLNGETVFSITDQASSANSVVLLLLTS